MKLDEIKSDEYFKNDDLKPFISALNKAGFSKRSEFDKKSKFNPRLVIFTKKINDHRVVYVTLFGDGMHQVSFSYDGVMTTPSTDFKTVDDMVKAIAIETSKKPKK